VKPVDDEPTQFVLFINLRRIPPRTGAQSKAHLVVVEKFNKRTGASLTVAPELSYFLDEPLGFDPNAKIVKRLMAVYSRATGEKKPQARHLRRRHVRQTPPQRDRLRHVVPRQALSRPRRRREDPDRRPAPRRARADPRAGGHRDGTEDRDAFAP
jgi:hypothetical protein